MIKKFLLSVSVCMMAVMLTCGCGSKEEPVEEPAQEEEEVVLVIETPEGEIILYHNTTDAPVLST